jgi:hypothetical protein
MIRQLIVGAYAAAPPTREDGAQFYARLRDAPGIAGLEVPCGEDGALSAPGGESWLVDQRSRAWTLTITALPATMAALAERPEVGLASNVESGRVKALRLIARIRDTVERLATVHGVEVPAVLVHSAPRVRASPSALEKSLREISSWGWSKTRIVLEHCDAGREGRSAAKGFLELSAELEILRSDPQLGAALVNWGRSAIEARTADGPLRHVTDCRAAGLLYGVVFSGASAHDSEFGPAWADAHLPVGPEGASLMTVDHIRDAIDAAGPEVVYGVKVAAPRSASWSARVAVVSNSLRTISCLDGGSATGQARPVA